MSQPSFSMNNLRSTTFSYSSGTGSYTETLGSGSDWLATMPGTGTSSGFKSLGNTLLQTTTGDITLNNTITSSAVSGNAIVIASGAAFKNHKGADALNPGSGRWLVYSADPANDIFGDLNSGNTALWNKTYSGYAPDYVVETGNRYLFSYQPTLFFTPNNVSKTYGNAATLTGFTVSGYQGVQNAFNSDDPDTLYSGLPSLASAGTADTAHAGYYDINIGQGTLESLLGYTFGFESTGTLTVDRATLTTTGAVAQNKVYDATRAATISAGTLAGLLFADNVTVAGGGTFADKNVGTGKTVTANLFLEGEDAGNYILTQPTALTADITAKNLTVSGAVAHNKVYDRTVAATISGETLAGLLTGDIVTVSGDGTFADKNAGTSKTVTAALTLGGADAANYSFTQPTGLTADITVRPLSTWTATSSGLWSNPANWDAIPDGQNVLAVSIPTGGDYQVTFDAGNTTLENLNSSQTLVMANGNLTIGTKLDTTALQQTGGVINGAGFLNVSASFNQTGGSIHLTGPATLVQSTGDLNIADLKASTVTLIAQAGRISQTGAIVTPSLVTSSVTGTVLNSANQVSNFSAANSTSGDIALTNSASPLSIAAITQSGPGDVIINNTGAIITGSEPVTSGGSVSLSAHSPLTIGSGGVKAVGDIILEASASDGSDNLSLNGPVASTTGGITLKAGDKVVIGTDGSTSAPVGGVIVTDESGTIIISPEPKPAPPEPKPAPPEPKVDTTAEVVKEIILVETTPIAPAGLMLAAFSSEPAQPQQEQPPVAGGPNGSKDKEEEKDKDKDKDKKKDEQEQQPAGGDKNDAKLKKNYCN